MSRIPPGPGNGPSPPYHPHQHHPQHQHQHPQPASAPQQQSQQMYYPPAPPSRGGPVNYPPPPGDGMYGNAGPPPRSHNYATYQPPMSSNGSAGWSDGYGPPPGSSSGSSGIGGPSSMSNGQAPQSYSHHTPPDIFYPPGPASNPPPGTGWSSVHPSASSKGGSSSGRPGTRGNQQTDNIVKMEDSIQSERTRGRPTASAAQGPPLTTAPLRSASARDGSRPSPTAGPSSTSAAAAAAAAAADAGGAAAGPSEFIKKLYKMLEEESAMYGRGIPPGHPRPEGAKRGSVGWGRGGSTFVVWDMNDFTTKILPQTFRHSNFSSFVRQLNKYGFSKIKHADENTGQIKENVWEFQHPNFQAGQKADLDSIKRKAVVPKKGEDGESSTGVSKGMNQEDSTRLSEMESRVSGLEDQLALALEEIRLARVRETGLHNLARDMIFHMTHLEKGTVSSPMSDPMPSPQVSRLHHILDGIAGPSFVPYPGPGPASHRSNPNSASGSSGSRTATAAPTMTFTSHVSPNSSAGRANEATTPEGLNNASRQVQPGSGDPDDAVEVTNAQQTLYNGDPIGLTPTFADMSSWFTEDPTGSIPAYNRKSSGGATLKLMLDTLATQGNHGINIQAGNPFEVDEQDPLDTSPRPESKQGRSSAPGTSPFGSLELPKETEVAKTKKKKTPYKAPVHRRSTTITTSWMHAPKILVVEDDVVYRQLSSKFLEKFGCVIETVEDAQQAIEKMNHTKYDLVLMDIFFGPSMDGRKATSLIRQFDIYTPIISMTSNAQPQDVDSYLQSGMNDILAKPFTKYGLFGILDKHLIHLKAIQMSAEIPRSLGLPPLSDQGVVDAVVNGGNNWNGDTSNPLASMGWSDDTYQAILQQFLSTGSMPEVSQLNFETGSIGTNVIFGDNRKRAIELIDDDWTSPGTDNGGPTPSMPPPAIPAVSNRGAKRMKGGVGAK